MRLDLPFSLGNPLAVSWRPARTQSRIRSDVTPSFGSNCHLLPHVTVWEPELLCGGYRQLAENTGYRFGCENVCRIRSMGTVVSCRTTAGPFFRPWEPTT